MLGVKAVKVSEKYSVHVTQSSKSSLLKKKRQALDTNLKIVPMYQLLHTKTIKKNNKKSGYVQNIVNRKFNSGLG